ncbi:MAG TPA: CoA ester lyase [Humibacter sp.]|nr:CoA ester lyase [Humibacter sp.]
MRPFDLGPALLFCPADRPDRYEKALARADAVILDLEDAVAPSAREAAREALRQHPLDPARVIVRVNAPGTDDQARDLVAVADTGYAAVMVPKASTPAGIEAVIAVLPDAAVIALCETAAGVLAAPALAAHPAVAALMWGAEDLVASLGGTASRHPDGRYREVAVHARSSVLLAAGAYGKPAIDTVHTAIGDIPGLAAEAEDAAAVGFTATACIHPSQVDTIRTAYRPDPEQLEWAIAVLHGAEETGGVFRLGTQMIDEPLLRHARALLRRAR